MISDVYCKEIIDKVLNRECIIQWNDGSIKKFSTIKTFNPLNNTVTLTTVADSINGRWQRTDEHFSIKLTDKCAIAYYKIRYLSLDEFKILLIK